MSVTTDFWTACDSAGGWDAVGTLLEIEYDHTLGPLRAADLRFLSIYPQEQELVFPPLTFLKVDPDSATQRGNKQVIKCSLVANASPVWIDTVVDDFTSCPKAMEVRPRSHEATGSSTGRDAFYRFAVKRRPEFINPLRATVLRHPVKIVQGRLLVGDDKPGRDLRNERYEREDLEQLRGSQEFVDGKFEPDLALQYAIQDMRDRHEAAVILVSDKNNKDGVAERERLRQSEVLRVDALGSVFQSLDAMERVIKDVTWEKPMFMVIGSESSGKSSLLERIAMIPIFPRGEGIVTRMPIRVQLRRATSVEATTPHVSVINWRTGQPHPNPKLANRIVQVRDGDETIRKVMKQVLDHMDHTDGIDMEHMLVVNISRPSVPSMDLVDLPGLVSTPPKMKEATSKLINRFVDMYKANSVFLLVLKADERTSNSVAYQVCWKQDVLNKTIGVITFCDKVNDQNVNDSSKLVNLLLGERGERVPKPHGWIATSNKQVVASSSRRCDELQRLEEQAKNEVSESVLGGMMKRVAETVGRSDLVEKLSEKIGCAPAVPARNPNYFFTLVWPPHKPLSPSPPSCLCLAPGTQATG